MEIENDPEKYCFTEFLPKFREKGVVTIIADVNLVLHSSTSRSTLQGVGGPQTGKTETG